MKCSLNRSLVVSVVALLIFFALALQAVVIKSPTADEGMHLLRGQVLRQTNELGLQGQHTPLSHWLIGTFFFSEPSASTVTDLPSWSALAPQDLVQEFLWSGDVDVSRLLFLGRLPILFAALLLGALISRWARLLAGFSAVLIALTLYAFSPNLLASAGLATTDLVATCAYFSAAFGVWFYWRRPSLARWLLAGLALGLAISAKLTGLLILPVTLILCYSESGRYNQTEKSRMTWWRPALRWLSWLPLAGLVLWAAYRFEVGYVAGLSFPLPASTFLANFVEVQQHIERGHYSFLLGERSNQGWWVYFGLAYIYKTPVVAFLLLVVAMVFVTWQRLWRKTLALWLPAGALFLAATMSKLNIGFRHVLPMTPFLWLFIGMTGPVWRRRRAGRWFLAAILLLYALGTFLQAPHFLAYFSELVGGSANGYFYLGDSNIDWGQDLKLLADYDGQYDKESLTISYFGPSDPAYYGLNAPPLFDEAGSPIGFAPANPAAGRYAISVNHLQGATPAAPDLFDWFRRQEPLGRVGYSILTYDVVEQKDGRWIGHCLDPIPMLDERAAELFVDRSNLRHVYFDCRQSWVVPAGGDSGWFIVPRDLDPATIDPVLAEQLALVFDNDFAGYHIYYWPGLSSLVEEMGWHRGEFRLTDGSPVKLPRAVEGMAQLVGGFATGPVWASVWEAEASSEAPISVQMHLYEEGSAGQAQSPLVGDGLGFVAAHWLPGDLIVQYYDFATESGLHLETGLYDYTTGERIPFVMDTALNEALRFSPRND